MPRSVWRSVLVLSASVLTVLIAVPAPAARAEESMRVEVAGEGAVRARGAAAVVRLRISCVRELTTKRGAVLRAFVQVAQRTQDGRLTQFHGVRELQRCGPTPQVVLVPAGSPGTDEFGTSVDASPLRPGPAAVRGSVVHCLPGDDDCSGDRDVDVQTLVLRDDLDRPRMRASSVQLALPSQVTLLAGGAAVRVRMPYLCSGGFQTVTVALRQTQGDRATTVVLHFSEALECDGTRRVLEVEELATDRYAFRARSAWLSTSVQGCSPDCGTSGQAWRQIALVHPA